jgi:hypothetical protein
MYLEYVYALHIYNTVYTLYTTMYVLSVCLRESQTYLPPPPKLKSYPARMIYYSQQQVQVITISAVKKTLR